MAQKFLDNEQTSFDPEAIDILHRAYLDACGELALFPGDQRGREVIAARIIEIARNGMIDATAISQRVVSEARKSWPVAQEQPPLMHRGQLRTVTKPREQRGRSYRHEAFCTLNASHADCLSSSTS